jgi:hypothetical protein
MGSNSFLLKGWSVTLAAILALTANNPNVYLLAVAILPALTFWGLDAYCLRQKRLFRKLYEDVIRGEVDAYFMDTSRYRCSVDSWFKTLFSSSVLPFHGKRYVRPLVAAEDGSGDAGAW